MIDDPIRPKSDIQRAHDLLAGIVLGEAPDPFGGDPAAQHSMLAQLDVLCWILQHAHNTNFDENLANMEQWLKAKGFTLENTGN